MPPTVPDRTGAASRVFSDERLSIGLTLPLVWTGLATLLALALLQLRGDRLQVA